MVSISDVLLPLSYLQKPLRVKVQIGSWWEGDWMSGMLLINKFMTFFIPHTLGEGQDSSRVMAGGPEPSRSPGSTWATSGWLGHLTAADLRSGAQSSFLSKCSRLCARTREPRGAKEEHGQLCIASSPSLPPPRPILQIKALSHHLPLSPKSELKKPGLLVRLLGRHYSQKVLKTEYNTDRRPPPGLAGRRQLK